MGRFQEGQLLSIFAPMKFTPGIRAHPSQYTVCPAGQFFAYENTNDACYDDNDQLVINDTPQCKPYLKLGDECNNDEFVVDMQLNSENQGCAPPLKCSAYGVWEGGCVGVLCEALGVRCCV